MLGEAVVGKCLARPLPNDHISQPRLAAQPVSLWSPGKTMWEHLLVPFRTLLQTWHTVGTQRSKMNQAMHGPPQNPQPKPCWTAL